MTHIEKVKLTAHVAVIIFICIQICRISWEHLYHNFRCTSSYMYCVDKHHFAKSIYLSRVRLCLICNIRKYIFREYD